MKDSLILPAPVDRFLRRYRQRTRKLAPRHVTSETLEEVAEVVAFLRSEAPLATHRRLLILMLYFGTTLLADELARLNTRSVFDLDTDELILKSGRPNQPPRKLWLDMETIPVMRSWLDRLPPEQDALFADEKGEPMTRAQVYQLVTAIPDEEEGTQLDHFFPVYHESDYRVIPTALRLNADTNHTGRGVTIAFIDSGFFPHPDLVKPRNRVRAYVNVAEPTRDDFHLPEEDSWHGMQTSVVAAGNGFLSKGLYKGIAPDADVVLLKVRGRQGIQTRHIIDAIEWILKHQKEYNIRVVNISLSGDRPGSYLRSVLDHAVEAAVQAGVIVVAAAGNRGDAMWSETIRPPASAPSVITVGGLNDNNRLDVNAYEMYWSSYGPTLDGILKPEIVAPGIWVAAPLLPGHFLYHESGWIHLIQKGKDDELQGLVKDARGAGVEWPESLETAEPSAIREDVARRIKEHKLVPPFYQHVDGTSFSAPIVCSVIAQMLEANPELTPARVKRILTTTTDKVYNVPIQRQGHGLVHPRKAVKEAANDLYRTGYRRPTSPYVEGRQISFYYRSDTATSVSLVGEFNGWHPEKNPMSLLAPGLWSITLTFEKVDSYNYKFVVDGKDWICDPENLLREPDGYGGMNARAVILV